MEHVRLAMGDENVADPALRFFPAEVSATAALIVMPGGACRAARYDWLGALANTGVHVAIVDGALSRFSSVSSGPAPAILELAAACAWLARLGVPLHGVGHSAGAAALLDALDPPSNPVARLPRDFSLAAPLVSVTSLGCSLQAKALDFDLPHRSETRMLYCPPETRLMFVAGDADAMAPPELVRRTCARYHVAPRSLVLKGATHYGWAGPREEGDNPKSDLDLTLDTSNQRRRTLDILREIINGN